MRNIALIAAVDVVLVVLFGTIGRSNHGESLTLGGISETVWPFLLALVVGWALAFILSAVRGHEPGSAQAFAPQRVFPEGVVIWIATVGFGMTARGLMTTDGVAISFVVVATIVLGIFLVGARLILRFVTARRAASAPGATDSR